ncbi:MAG: DUF1501 domain-containing protein [Actinobacteria bacterium]|nr:DUF1501 domain-containing protein [Actinomycetota bacterium]NDD61992.1 DUF1501 domain-containing protein [Actinomycetota bacterium]NDE52430.1 DUF1501 domain-containing protein [Actinomycetota bacterium]
MGAAMTTFDATTVTRRGFLAGSAAVGALLVLPSGVRAAFSAEASAEDTIVLNICMRGGFDSLAAVFPLSSADLAAARPSLCVPDSVALPLGNGWGLHPALAPLTAFWTARELALVVGAGSPTHSRSHFDETSLMARASYGSTTLARSGWIARANEELEAASALQSVSVSSSTLTSRNGTRPALAVGKLSNTKFPTVSGLSNATFEDFLRRVGTSSTTSWSNRATATADAVRQLEAARLRETAVQYPATEFATRLKDAAALVKSNLGVRFIDLDFAGDFDLHIGYGTVDNGAMRTLLSDLATGLAAFRADLADRWNNIVVTTVTEFGRRVSENASNGSDHGWASTMFVLGGRVNGGRVLGETPGLHATQLVDGDVRVTTDYRHVLGEVLTRAAGLSAEAVGRVFPRFSPQPLGIIR